jgi:hypothetical protein
VNIGWEKYSVSAASGARVALYLLGVIVVVVGVWFILSAAGIFDVLGRAVAIGIIVLILGLGIMAASHRISEPWGPRRRRYYESNAGTATTAPPATPNRPVVRTGPTGERIVEEEED